MKEAVLVLQQAWKGEPFDFEGTQLRIRNGLCVPAPPVPPRVVVGVGSSRRLLRSAVTYADEVNVYADEELMREARREIEASGREIALSTFVWEWREDIEEKLREWEQLGVERTFVTFWEPFNKLERAANWLR